MITNGIVQTLHAKTRVDFSLCVTYALYCIVLQFLTPYGIAIATGSMFGLLGLRRWKTTVVTVVATGFCVLYGCFVSVMTLLYKLIYTYFDDNLLPAVILICACHACVAIIEYLCTVVINRVIG